MTEKGYIKQTNLIEGTFLERKNRFVAVVKTGDTKIICHLPNPGRMKELLIPNQTNVLLELANDQNRRTDATIVACFAGNELINLDTRLFRDLLAFGIENNVLPLFNKWTVNRFEIPIDSHRYDMLINTEEKDIIVEVKSTTRVVREIACFPDAVSARASRHVNHLFKLSKTRQVAIIFLVYRHARAFFACQDIDPSFTNSFLKVQKKIPIYPILIQTQKHKRGLMYSFDKILPISNI